MPAATSEVDWQLGLAPPSCGLTGGRWENTEPAPSSTAPPAFLSLSLSPSLGLWFCSCTHAHTPSSWRCLNRQIGNYSSGGTWAHFFPPLSGLAFPSLGSSSLSNLSGRSRPWFHENEEGGKTQRLRENIKLIRYISLTFLHAILMITARRFKMSKVFCFLFISRCGKDPLWPTVHLTSSFYECYLLKTGSLQNIAKKAYEQIHGWLYKRGKKAKWVTFYCIF